LARLTLQFVAFVVVGKAHVAVRTLPDAHLLCERFNLPQWVQRTVGHFFEGSDIVQVSEMFRKFVRSTSDLRRFGHFGVSSVELAPTKCRSVSFSGRELVHSVPQDGHLNVSVCLPARMTTVTALPRTLVQVRHIDDRRSYPMLHLTDVCATAFLTG
jgi:hypothetical protein